MSTTAPTAPTATGTPAAPAPKAAPRAGASAGTAQAALGVLCFSFSFPATAWALTGFGPWTATGLRGLLAGVLAALCLAAARVPLPERRHWPGLLVVSAGCVLGFPLLTTLALRTSSTAHSAVVIGVLPLATAAVAVLRAGRSGARPSRLFWGAALAGAVAVLGFTLLQSHGRPGLADLYLFAALLVCGAGYAEGGRISRELPGWQVIGWAVVAALPVTALTTALALPAEPVEFGGKALAGLAYTAVVSQFGGFVVWYRGMAAIGVPRASQLQLAQPLLTLVWSVLLLGEALPAAAPVTAVVVLLCIALTQRARV
ncbi:Permease of the drug/metabolite transporter (DMT) superfamily [Streptomyces sp. TLI_053]|uniref:DMT family transporter n=1 Tax=Streptomyces sp. TLI_053 TaxID=1855352 RepID=UPI00087B8B6E|nr:DMT family transporter [Streptomyces sp. TLI_053]SDT73984.1 Permease of the drug/metabolite transporter (DMT) superfamily [Streptomyces sp. TLI_053]